MPPVHKPKVHPLVPIHEIDRHLDRVHVATPDADIVADITAALETRTDPRWTPAIRRQTIRYALWRHARNYSEYLAVVTGRAL